MIWGACRPTLLTPKAENRLGTPSEPEVRCREVLEVVEVHRDPMRRTELDDIAEIRMCGCCSVLCRGCSNGKKGECRREEEKKKRKGGKKAMDASLSSRGEKNKEKKKKRPCSPTALRPSQKDGERRKSKKAGNRAPSLDATFPFLQFTLQRSASGTASRSLTQPAHSFNIP